MCNNKNNFKSQQTAQKQKKEKKMSGEKKKSLFEQKDDKIQVQEGQTCVSAAERTNREIQTTRGVKNNCQFKF